MSTVKPNPLRVYVAGPYRHPDPVSNTHRAIVVGNQIIELGHAPYVPHLTMFQHLQHPREERVWLELDLVWLRQCNVVYRMPDESAGADAEVAEANRLDIPVFFDWAALEDFLL